MRILILGAGQVGSSVAEALASESNDICVIDQNAACLQQLAKRLNVRTLVGNAASPNVLKRAGIEDADLLIALTQSDETNLVACKIAKTFFNVPTRVARLREADYLKENRLLADENFSVSHAISPEQDITDYVVRLIQFPEALQVLQFAEGSLTLICVRAYIGGPLVGKPISAMHEHLPRAVEARIAAIFRDHKAVEPEGSTVIESGDEVFLLAATAHIRTVLAELRRMQRPVKRVMIAGGGNIGARVAEMVERNHQVKVIEHNVQRAEAIAATLKNSVVLNGEATDSKVLLEENIDEMDMFIALTNDDENNIMAASLAKRLGCPRVVALINRRAYAEMIEGGPVDIGISPAQISIGSLLAFVRQGSVARVHSLRRGAAEALELVVHGDARSSKVVGRRIDELPVIPGARIAAIVRQTNLRSEGLPIEERRNQVIIPHHNTVIQEGDHVVVFCTSKKRLPAVEKLFMVGLGYF